jgi:hypothetical protein
VVGLLLWLAVFFGKQSDWCELKSLSATRDTLSVQPT